MTSAQLFEALARTAGVVFVVSSMLAMGLSLTVPMILRPLRRWPVVVAALAANFVAVPLLALGISEVTNLDDPSRDGLMIVALAAGSPFLPKLIEGARGDIAFAVGLMVVLMVATVIVLPAVLPGVLEGASIGAWDIAESLVVLMLAPLASSLALRANWPDLAEQYGPLMSRTSTVAIVVLVVVAVGLNVDAVLDLVGTGGLVAAALLAVTSVTAGLVVGGRRPHTRVVVGLGTGQRNLSAALVVASQNFAGTDTFTFVLVASLVFLVLLLPTAPLIGRLVGTHAGS